MGGDEVELVWGSELRTEPAYFLDSYPDEQSRAEAIVAAVSCLPRPLLLYTTPLLIVHACEAIYDNVLVIPRLPAGVRYSVYAATFYLTMLFGNFGGAEFIYFQF